MSSITYSERIKIETFCELGLSNIQMGRSAEPIHRQQFLMNYLDVNLIRLN
ncbi:Mobile element protein [Levilactobacillus brevis]|nr:Mobile element protein [Levilactobacillus brevis]